jgi:hypothetical protein
MRIPLIGAARPSQTRDKEVSWTQAYARRMRRFNLEVIFVALISSIILLASWVFSYEVTLIHLIPIGFLVLSLVFYLALIFSIYAFHNPARWAFFGVVGSLLLACIASWLC